jgi:alanine racemase
VIGPEFREIQIDLGALRRNVSHLKTVVGVEHLMIVVKADAYGHGMVPCARTAVDAGADWLGVVDVQEALTLRQAGIQVPILAWLHSSREDFQEALANRITIGVSSLAQLDAVANASFAWADGPAPVHLKLDTGLSRNGIAPEEWRRVFERAKYHEGDGAIVVEGLFTHLAGAGPQADLSAHVLFEEGIAHARDAGLNPSIIHLAATSTALTSTSMRYNMVRIGIGAYGVSPDDTTPVADLGLTPVMTVRSRVAAVRKVPAGVGVSYEYDYVTQQPTTLALVPLGYAEGIPRSASNVAPVNVAGQVRKISGRVAMDQFIVDMGSEWVTVGDPVVVFGDPKRGHPSASDFARACGTIGYEIVTRMGGRCVRVYVEL